MQLLLYITNRNFPKQSPHKLSLADCMVHARQRQNELIKVGRRVLLVLFSFQFLHTLSPNGIYLVRVFA